MKKLYLIYFIFFITLKMFSQFNFEKNVIIDETHGTNSLDTFISIDIDSDGDLDVLSASGRDHAITWYDNIDDSNDFFAHSITSGFMRFDNIYGGDIDQDGDIDVLGSSQDDSIIVWFENIDGNGNFGEPNIIARLNSGARDVQSIILADVDGDLDLDILAMGDRHDDIVYFKNINGNGNFGPPIFIADNPFNPDSFEVGDLDGDGDLDVLASSFSNKIVWYENLDGDDSFGTMKTVNEVYDSKIKIVDIDGDGDNDIVSTTDSQIGWQENIDGNGNFGEIKNIGGDYNYIESISTGDFDNDGDIDIALTSEGDEKFVWFENADGNGNYGLEQIIIDGVKRPINVYFEDLDHDQDMDVLVGSYFDGISWLENQDSDGTFGSVQPITKNVEYWANTILSGDIDGDGDLDLVSSSASTLAWYENLDSNGQFSTQRLIARDGLSYPGYESRAGNSLSLGDVDNDGDIDILIISKSSDSNSWLIKLYRNMDGRGNFSTGELVHNFTFYIATHVKLFDIDDDNDLDIVISFNDGVKWLPNYDGNGNFGAEQNIFSSRHSMVAFGDLDSDTKEDAVGSSLGRWRKGFGDSFQNGGRIIASGIIGYNTVIVDLNNDGMNDILSGNRWFKNLDTSEDFEIVTNIDYTDGSHVQVGDFDNDGDLDIVSTPYSSEDLYLSENTDALGNFGSKISIDSESNDPNHLHVADLDGDGDLDIVSISQLRINWYRNSLDPNHNIINGSITLDENSNGCGDEDIGLSNKMIIAESMGNDYATFTDQTGNFKFFVSEGTYDVSVNSNLPEYYLGNPDSRLIEFNDLGNSAQTNFCIEPISEVDDLEISIYPTLNDPRPGFSTYYYLIYKNNGTKTISTSIDFEFDDTKLTFVDVSGPSITQNSNVLSLDINNLKPYRTGSFILEFKVATIPTVNINDLIVTKASASLSTDAKPENNTFELQQTVIGSYDPNDISVLEGEEILEEEANNYLHYLIRFQNTGNAEAINVEVENILDDKFDWQSMELEKMSHNGEVLITNGKNVSFIFNDINLPDSTSNEPDSHGFIAYRIKPKQNSMIGDVFLNTADIYFDFNPPIITNTVRTEIVSVLSNEKKNLAKVLVYPNPTTGQINIQSSSIIKKIECYNNLGQMIQVIKSNNLIDLSEFATGIYFLKIYDNAHNISMAKILKI